MLENLTHVRHQGPVLAALGRAALSTIKEKLGQGPPAGGIAVPGPELRETVPPRDEALVKAYLRSVKGDPRAYGGALPAHFFPQYAFPLLSKVLAASGYPLARGMNGGCRLTMDAPLPANEPLNLAAHLAAVDDDGARAILTQALTIGTASAPAAVTAELRVFIPLGPPPGEKGKKGGSKDKKKKKDKARVPDDVREIAFFKVKPQDALDFACLTGDFNPIHWVPLIARASGFKNTILHGFATFARAIEGLNASVFAGDPTRLRSIDVRFTRPLVLPARVGLYVDGSGGVFVGDAPGGPAYLTGSFERA
ncbi:MAG: hypothetical protein H6745_24480 [Deltaproteobacteria bacterium]|nr:hypothetical protein [Deltaproteobacteria bacterium]